VQATPITGLPPDPNSNIRFPLMNAKLAHIYAKGTELDQKYAQ